jgi:hypothetical protein
MSLLNALMVSRAQKANQYYEKRLKWPLPDEFRDAASPQLAQWVANKQRESGQLRVNGILGPKTWSYLQTGEKWRPPLCDYIIVAGEKIPTPLPLVSFDHPEGISFYELPNCWEFRDKSSAEKIDLFVLHWDGARSAHDCFHILIDRGLSVQFLLDGDGTLYQTLDLVEGRAWHARQHNGRSIGVEIQNPWRTGADLRSWDEDLRSSDRPVVEEILPHTDRPWKHLDFTDEQKTALKIWVPFLCDALGIPKKLPLREDGTVETGLIDPKFSGVCGHYHLQTDKIDPGLSLWPILLEAFRSEVDKGEKEKNALRKDLYS